MTTIRDTLAERFAMVEQHIAGACARVGRERSAVTLVAVTKTISADIAAILPELGVFDLGENRPQTLWDKAAFLPTTIRWHLIGHLQRNKIDKTLPLVSWIHSVDSLRLLQALEQEAGKQQRKVNALLEVNASGEASKGGFAPAELPTLVPALREVKHVQLRGLMTMAPLQDAEACRPTFVLLRQLRDQLKSELADTHTMEHLSMGMSNDFEVAIEEGATFIRVGTVLFEGLKA